MKSFYSNFITTSGLKNLSAVFGLIFSLVILANAAPVNDNFANAQVISGNSGQVSGTNVAATKESGEPAHALNRGGASVWYKYVAPGNGVLRVDTLTSNFNTLLAVYSGSNMSNLTLIAANDEDDSGSGSSKVYFGTQSGTTYYIAVDGKFSDGSGVVTGSNLKVNYSFDNVMPNDNFANAVTLRNDLPIYSATFTNVGASKEIGEPNHSSNSGGKSVWFKWQTPSATAKNYTITLDQKSVANPSGFMIPLFRIYTGSSLNSLTTVANYGADRVGRLKFIAQPNTTYYIAVDGYDFGGGAGAQLGNFMLTVNITKSLKVPDFDRDGKADITVYRPTTGTFYSLDSTNDNVRAFQWGVNGDKPLINENDGDGKPDYCVYRPDTQTWYNYRSFSNTYLAYNWGIATDIPMSLNQYEIGSGGTGNFVTIFRQSTGTWWINRNGFSQSSIQFGQNGDIPMTAEFNGDATDEIAVFRPSNGTWYILLNQTTFEYRAVQFGLNGDKPVAADYDGDGRTDIAVYRPSNGTWYVLRSSDGVVQAAQFGISTDKPQPADYDGDSKADYAVYRNGTWWILQSSNGTVKAVSFGLSNDLPITAPAN